MMLPGFSAFPTAAEPEKLGFLRLTRYTWKAGRASTGGGRDNHGGRVK